MPPPRPATTVGTPHLPETLPAESRVPDDEARQVTTEDPHRYAVSPTELGRGGIGRVVLAFDEHLGREVAMKELLPPQELATTAVTPGKTSAATARFLREARVTAQLEHPNIVPVYEVGKRTDGTLYYTMKRVRGRTLADALDHCDTLAQRMHLLGHFLDVCQAIAYAHSRGVIHRDLKPHNVMVGQFGETVVLDWGLARARGRTDIRGNELAREVQQLTEQRMTLDGSTLGTPAYMSPEQAAGRIDDIDERSDVWSLGTVLFELLAGEPPFKGSTAYEIVRKVLDEKPPPVLAIAPDAPPELAAIADKALQRDKAARYQTAAQLADDVDAYLTGQRVSAHQYSSAQEVERFVGKNQTGLYVALAVVLVSVVTAAGVSMITAGARDESRAEASRASDELARQKAHALLARAQQEWASGNGSSAGVLAAQALRLDDKPATRGLLVAIASRPLPRLAWQYRTIHACQALAFSPSGEVLACGADGGVVVLDGATGKERKRVARTAGTARSLAFLDENTLLLGTATGAKLWNVATDATGELAQDGMHPARMVAVSQDRFALLGEDDVLLVWPRSGGSPTRFTQPGLRAVAISPFDTWVTDRARAVSIGRANSGVNPLHVDAITALAVDHVGSIFSGDAGGRIHSFTRMRLHGHRGPVRWLAASADGALLFSAGLDGTIAAWRTDEGTNVMRLGGGVAAVSSTGMLAADVDGKLVRAWRVSHLVEPTQLPPSRSAAPRMPGCTSSSTWNTLTACGNADGTVALFDGGTQRWSARVHDGPVSAVAFSSDGGMLASGGRDQKVQFLDVAAGRLMASLDEKQGAIRALELADGVLRTELDDDRWTAHSTASVTASPDEIADGFRRVTGLTSTENGHVLADPSWAPSE